MAHRISDTQLTQLIGVDRSHFPPGKPCATLGDERETVYDNAPIESEPDLVEVSPIERPHGSVVPVSHVKYRPTNGDSLLEEQINSGEGCDADLIPGAPSTVMAHIMGGSEKRLDWYPVRTRPDSKSYE